MDIDQFKRILTEFAREARRGRITSTHATGVGLADLAEQLEGRIGRAQRLHEVKSTEISFSPSRCPCCGK